MRRLRRPSDLSAKATEEIRMAILRGELDPGSRIRQEELATRLAVSRAPIRQALVILEREGLVQTDGLQGVIVAPLDPDVVRDLYGFRAAIERHVAETLAARRDLSWGPLHDLVEAGRRADPDRVSELIELDLRFHTELYTRVGNRVLSEVMAAQWIKMRRALGATLTMPGYSHRVWEEHAGIIAAIEAHQAEEAGRLAASHTAAASARLIAGLTPRTPA